MMLQMGPKKRGATRGRITKEDGRIIISGLLHESLNGDQLTPKAKDEIRVALDKVLDLVGV